jgi:hypothetical protein
VSSFSIFSGAGAVHSYSGIGTQHGACFSKQQIVQIILSLRHLASECFLLLHLALRHDGTEAEQHYYC